MKKRFVKKALVFLFVLCNIFTYPIRLPSFASQNKSTTVIVDESSEENTPGYLGIMPLDIGNYEEDL